MLAFFAGAEEQGKFALFVSEYERLMFHTANGILNNYHDAEEAVYSALAAVARRFSAVSALAPEKKAAYARRAAPTRARTITETIFYPPARGVFAPRAIFLKFFYFFKGGMRFGTVFINESKNRRAHGVKAGNDRCFLYHSCYN